MVRIFDITGKAVINLPQAILPVGEQVVSVVVSSLPPGLYYIVLQTPGGNYSGKFVKI